MVTKSLKVCGLTLNLDGSENHEWCEHNFGKDYRQLLTEQREAWKKVNDQKLPPLQLPLVPTVLKNRCALPRYSTLNSIQSATIIRPVFELFL